MAKQRDRNKREDREDEAAPGTPARVAKGKALPRSESDLFLLTDIRKPEIDKSRRDWKAKTLPQYAGLIEARLEEA